MCYFCRYIVLIVVPPTTTIHRNMTQFISFIKFGVLADFKKKSNIVEYMSRSMYPIFLDLKGHKGIVHDLLHVLLLDDEHMKAFPCVV